MTKCIHCGLTLADPPNGEEDIGSLCPSKVNSLNSLNSLNSVEPPTTPPYRAEVIDNAVLALAGGIKV